MSKFEAFKECCKQDLDAMRESLKTDGVYTYNEMVKRLRKVQNNMNQHTLVVMFGDQLGEHLWEKFVIENHRNALSWMSKLNEEYLFFFLSEVKRCPEFPQGYY